MKNALSAQMGTAPIGKLIFRISLPIALSSTVQALYNIVDGIYVSALSEDAFTATSLFFSVNMIMVALISGMASGLNTLLSYSLGSGQKERRSEIILTGLFLASIMSAIFAFFGVFGSKLYYQLFRVSTFISYYGVSYMRICMICCLPAALSCVLERILQATNRASYSMIAQISGAVVNILLDPLLIFGKFGLPAMGINGAALATVIGQSTAAILAFAFNLTKNNDFKVSLRGFCLRFTTIADIYRVGLPVTAMQVIGTVMTFSINQILMAFSPSAVTVFGIYYKVQMFIFMQIFAFGQGNLTLVAYNRGAQKYTRIRESIRCTMLICVAIAIVGTVIFQFFSDELLSLFRPTQEVRSMGRHALQTISLIFPIEAICVTFSYSFQGLGHGGLSLFHSVVRQLLLRVPLAYILSACFGLDAVWYAFIVAEIVAVLLTSLLYRNLRQKELLYPDANQVISQ